MSETTETTGSFTTLLWEPAALDFALAELRREFPRTPPEGIVRAVDIAARKFAPDVERVQLLQGARAALRTED